MLFSGLMFSIATCIAVLSVAALCVLGEPLVSTGSEDFNSFKLDVFNEIRQLKENERRLESEIGGLENKVSELEAECARGNAVTRSRRQSVFNSLQIAFTAYKDKAVHNLTHDQPIVYNQVLLNDGDAYDPATGMFNAPVSGVYLFSYSVGAKALPSVPLSQYDVFTRLVINGVHQVSAAAESTGTYDDEQGSSTAILFVEEGSRVWTLQELRGGNNLYSTDDERVTSFTGALLYTRDTLNAIVG